MTVEQRITAAGLPAVGAWRYEPPARYVPTQALPRNGRGEFLDKYGNRWRKPKGILKGPLHWDVQLGKTWKRKFRNKAKYLNIDAVSGEIDHGAGQ